MKRLILLLTFVIVSFSTSYSQDRGHIGLSVGLSAPMGDFANNKSSDENAGFATAGLLFDFSLNYKLNKTIGIEGLVRVQSNGTDADALADEFSAITLPGTSGTVESGKWLSVGILGGISATFPLTERFGFNSKILIGVQSSTSPELTVTLNGPGGYAWVKQESGNGTAFAYLIGAGFNYGITEKADLLINIDYLGAEPEFSDVETTTSLGDSSKGSFDQPMSTINFGLGIALKF